MIIPVFNEAANLAALTAGLEALVLGANDEVLLVDDGSTDGSGERLQAWVEPRGGRFRLVRLPENRGRAEAINAGAREARGDLCAFTDADARPPTDWLDRIRGWFADPAVIAGGGAFAPTNPDQGWVRYYHLGDQVMNEILRKQLTANKLSGVNSAVRRTVLLEVGGFRREAWWSEDSDLCFRLQQRGRVHYDPKTVVLTAYPATLAEIVRRKWIWGQAMGLKFRQEGVPEPRLLIRPAALTGLAALLAALPLLSTEQRRTVWFALLALHLFASTVIWGAGRGRLGLPAAWLVVPLLLVREAAYVAGFYDGLWRGAAVADRPSWKQG